MSQNQSFSKKRPTFIQFRNLFMEVINEYAQNDGEMTPFSIWNETGDSKQRALILASFRDKLVEDFSMGENLEIKKQLVELEGPVESVITQLFHSFSTLTLVEHINETVLEKQKARRGEK